MGRRASFSLSGFRVLAAVKKSSSVASPIPAGQRKNFSSLPWRKYVSREGDLPGTGSAFKERVERAFLGNRLIRSKRSGRSSRILRISVRYFNSVSSFSSSPVRVFFEFKRE